MLITHRNQYALRAVLELGKHHDKGLIKVSAVAEAQAIPKRFLEVILNQLKRGGIVESKRGYHGGYRLVPAPDDLTVGDVFRLMQQDTGPLHCLACVSKCTCPLERDCAFFPMWSRIERAIYTIYDETTIQDLLNNERFPDDEPVTAETMAR